MGYGTIKSMTAIFFPTFEDDRIADHYWRAHWHLSPLAAQIGKVSLVSRLPIEGTPRIPDYLSDNLMAIRPEPGQIAIRPFETVEGYEAEVASADFVLLWDTDSESELRALLSNRKSSAQVVKIDHNRNQFAASFYLRLLEKFPSEVARYRRIGGDNLAKWSSRLEADCAYIFGTGPGLSLVEKEHIGPGLVVACNSMVVNDELLDRLNPNAFVAADPIFHAGPSSYAGKFREALLVALRKYEAPLFIPMRDAHIYFAALPLDLHDRIIPLEFRPGSEPLLDIRSELAVTTTANVLTLMLLPIASTFAKRIHIAGCDGRPRSESSYFWSHDKKSQINDEMGSIRDAHPAFFDIDYNDYYDTHCEILGEWIDAVERDGHEVVNMTPSHIEALRRRTPAPAARFGRPRVSVVMPMYNPGSFLTDAVRSVLSQSLGEFELLIVDDGSDEESLNLARALAAQDDRIKLISNSSAKGVSGARNTGIERAEGEFIAFLDADDTFDPGHLAARVRHMDAWPKCVMTHGAVDLIDDEGRPLDWTLVNKKTLTFEAMTGNPAHLNSIVLRAHVAKAFSFREGVTNGEDWWFVARLLRSGVTSEYVDGAASTYRIHRQSTVIKDVDGHENQLAGVIDWICSPSDEPSILGRFRSPLAEKGPLLLERQANLALWKLIIGADVSGVSDEVWKSIAAQSEANIQRRLRLWVIRWRGEHIESLASLPDADVQRLESIGAPAKAAGAKINAAMKGLVREARLATGLRSPDGFGRVAHAHVDETKVVSHMLADRTGRSHVMLDVGAHFGTSASYFDKLQWSIHCFEPDAKNREKLLARFGDKENVIIDTRAVSDTPATGVSFFTSEESTGISGLLSFRESHVESAKVDITTLDLVTTDRAITTVDFLKIDVEGFDLSVLKGVPWHRLKPDVIEAEFEDAKTLKLGHNYRDICDYLVERGYTIYLSEWHPIIRYGIPHDWRRIVKYPDHVEDNSWGNLLAFRIDPGIEAVRRSFAACMGFRKPTDEEAAADERARQEKTVADLAAAAEQSPLAAYRGRHKGQRCFILGNGPSLNRTDLSRLKDEIVFGCNGVDLLFDRIEWRPTYYVSVDSRVLPDRASEVSAMLGANPQMTGMFPEALRTHDDAGERIDTATLLGRPHNAVYFHETPNDPSAGVEGMFSMNAGRQVVMPYTVAITMLQLAAWMGFSEIYLVGCDTDYKIQDTVHQAGKEMGDGSRLLLTSTRDDDPNHFDPRYFGEGRKWHSPQVSKMITHYEYAKRALDKAGVVVRDATVGGKLDVFPKVSFESIFEGQASASEARAYLPQPRPERADASSSLIMLCGGDARVLDETETSGAPIMLLSGAMHLSAKARPMYLVALDNADPALATALSVELRSSRMRRMIVSESLAKRLPPSEKILDLPSMQPLLKPPIQETTPPIVAALAWAGALGFRRIIVAGTSPEAFGDVGTPHRAAVDSAVGRLDGSGIEVRFKA